VVVPSVVAAQRSEAVKVRESCFPLCLRLPAHAIPGPVLLSDELMATESDTDCGEADLGPTAQGGSGSLHVADSVDSLGLNVVEEVED
jgi:hypothetical protein